MFTGAFDGNGHVIKNLTINRPDDSAVGFFGWVEDAAFRDVGLEDVNVKGGSNSSVGGLVGWLDQGRIEGSGVTGRVTDGSEVGRW